MLQKNKQGNENEQPTIEITPVVEVKNKIEELVKKETPLKKIETNTVHLKSIEKKIVFNHRDKSRPSDLIKFEATPKNCNKKSIQPIKRMDEDQEDDDDDFLNLNSCKPISWRNSVANTNDIVIDITNSININLNLINGTPTKQNNTPKTPRNRKSLFLQQANGSCDIAKSPLLKLVYISSHGKRLSRSGQV